jgi:hypothetical protein
MPFREGVELHVGTGAIPLCFRLPLEYLKIPGIQIHSILKSGRISTYKMYMKVFCGGVDQVLAITA